MADLITPWMIKYMGSKVLWSNSWIRKYWVHCTTRYLGGNEYSVDKCTQFEKWAVGDSMHIYSSMIIFVSSICNWEKISGILLEHCDWHGVFLSVLSSENITVSLSVCVRYHNYFNDVDCNAPLWMEVLKIMAYIDKDSVQ